MYVKLLPEKKDIFQSFCNYCRILKNVRIKAKIISFSLLVLFLVFDISVNIQDGYAQNQLDISGTVTEQETGQPLTGVTIVVVGTDRGTTTDLRDDIALRFPTVTVYFDFHLSDLNLRKFRLKDAEP